MRGALAALVVVGCGRVDFTPPGDAVFVRDGGFPVRLLTVGSPGSYPAGMLDAWLQANTVELVRIPDNGSIIDFTSFDVVLFESLADSHDSGVAQGLADWVTAGGSFASVAAYNPNDDTAYNTLLASIGVQLSGNLDGTVTTFVRHPTTDGVLAVPFKGGYVVTGTGTTVATLGGQPVGVAGELGRGRYFVWGDEWITYDSQWGMPYVDRFWLDIMRWLSHQT